MLSIKAKEGTIKALFEAGGSIFLVTRVLTRSKAGGDSVKSRLYVISGLDTAKVASLLPDIISENVDIEKVLRDA